MRHFNPVDWIWIDLDWLDRTYENFNPVDWSWIMFGLTIFLDLVWMTSGLSLDFFEFIRVVIVYDSHVGKTTHLTKVSDQLLTIILDKRYG